MVISEVFKFFIIIPVIIIVIILPVVILKKEDIATKKETEADPYMKKGLAGSIITLVASSFTLSFGLRLAIVADWDDSWWLITIMIIVSIFLMSVSITLIMKRSKYNRVVDARYMEKMVSATSSGRQYK